MTDYNYDFVKVRVRDGIAWAALNRPEKRNAMSPPSTMRWTTRWRGSRWTTTSGSWS
jgi:1,4-dihydroxy-2-naphthoyl-CoA synthase